MNDDDDDDYDDHDTTTTTTTTNNNNNSGLAVACWTTDHYHPCSNPGVGISEGCFVFHPFSLPCAQKWP